MASAVTVRRYLLVILIFFTVVLSCTSGVDDYEPEVGPIGKHPGQEQGDEDHGHDTHEGNDCDQGHDGGDEDHGHESSGDDQGHEGEAEDGGESGDRRNNDPVSIVDGALLCFQKKRIYSSCEESYRLSARGDLHVLPEQVDEFCNGPCLEETNLILECLDGIMDHFLFYNQATTRDVRDTIRAGCGQGDQRGNFDVGEHIQAGEGSGSIGSEPASSLLSVIVITLIWHIIVL
ncbi:hypothetical protein RND81_12G139200 [Saponaria officinalis]|uniref:DUF7731 domain-containing protein n=1 Tax=Saponaria officinalis TaxID=3572 RepID=A0AAW1HA82_SAPOF